MGTYTGEIASVACAVIWAGAVVLFKKTGEQISPNALNLFKNVVAIPFVFATLLALGVPPAPDYGAWTYGILAISGILGISIGDAVFFASLNRIGTGWMGVVSCTYSPLVVLVTGIGFGVPLTFAITAGTVLVATAIVLASGRVWDPKRVHGSLLAGLLLGLLSHFVMAVGVSIMKYPIGGRPAVFDFGDALVITFWRLVIGTAVLAVFLLVRRDRASTFAVFRPARVWRPMLPGALLGGYLSMIIWIIGMKEISGSLARAAVLNQTTALFMPLFGVMFLREPLSVRKIAAVALAFLGATIVAVGD
jgi:drug/metabolite transporter (DMT)-like permease